VRGLAACLTGAEPGEIAFVPNTTDGLLIVSTGLSWEAGDNVVTAETEFRGNVYPWLALQRLGVETRFAPSHNGRIAVDDVVDLMDDRTRLVALSFVEVWTGFRNNLAAVGEACRERGIYFSVDGIQGLGALRLDVEESHVDFMSAGGHKWLLSPFGVGVFYCRKGLIDKLIPTLTGWRSFDLGDYSPYEAPQYSDARRFDFQGGNMNLSGIHGLGTSLEMILELGPEWIEGRIRGLTEHLIEGLQERRYSLISPTASWEERSGIVTFRHGEHSPAGLGQRLRDAGVIVAASLPGRPNKLHEPHGIRTSVHFLNTEDEIDRLLDALP
jgi:selenocysteine lyase/cysteine desulfurase